MCSYLRGLLKYGAAQHILEIPFYDMPLFFVRYVPVEPTGLCFGKLSVPVFSVEIGCSEEVQTSRCEEPQKKEGATLFLEIEGGWRMSQFDR